MGTAHCRHCGAPYALTVWYKIFCSAACREAHHTAARRLASETLRAESVAARKRSGVK